MQNVALFVGGYLIGGTIVATYLIKYMYKKGVIDEKVIIDS